MGVRNKRMLLVVLAGVACFLVAGILVVKKVQNNRSSFKAQCVTDATGTAINEDQSLLLKEGKERFKPMAEQITRLKDYEKNVTCLYALTMYYLNTEDTEKAQVTLNLLKPLINSGSNYGKNIKYPKPIKDIETLLQGIVSRQAEFKKNVLLTPLDGAQ